MNKPSKWEIMRRNRPKLIKSRETIKQRINRIEREMSSEWDTVAEAGIMQAAERMALAMERSLPKAQRPSRLQRLLTWTMGMERVRLKP